MPFTEYVRVYVQRKIFQDLCRNRPDALIDILRGFRQELQTSALTDLKIAAGS